MLARDAAIKLIDPGLLSARSGQNAALAQRRFEQEAKATASLRSPHTVDLYDFGVTEEGVFYYVMELLDGIDLETLVKQFGPLPPARVVSLMRQVCRSLSEAHRHGMIHRDIKATNIFVCRMGSEYDFAKVLDFGLVKIQGTNETQLTGLGSAAGTPAYMAPELVLGNPGIDGRTDIYCLGAVAYWLLTGHQVFEETGAPAMMMAHLNKVPVRPSQRLGAPLPNSLEQIVMKCLEKDPSDRPASADILAGLLERCADIGSWTPGDAENWWLSNMSESLPDTALAGSGSRTL
jgi:serine/threonine-protein kinase